MTFQPTTNQGQFNSAEYDLERVTRILTASVLGDGCLELRDGRKNACYRTSKTVGHSDYVNWLRSVVELVVPTKTHAIPAETIANTTYVRKAQDYLQSRQHPLLTDLHATYYHNRRKAVPEGLELDLESITILLQDDGTRCRTHGLIVICTDGFDLASVEILQEQFEAVTELPWTICKTSRLSKAGEVCYQLRLARRHVAELASMLKPWMFPSFYYKIGLEPDGITEIPLKMRSI